MSGVEFEEENSYGVQRPTLEHANKRQKLLIRFGIVKNEVQLNTLYLVVSLVLLIVSVTIIIFSTRSKIVPYEKIPQSVKDKLPYDARRILEQQNTRSKK